MLLVFSQISLSINPQFCTKVGSRKINNSVKKAANPLGEKSAEILLFPNETFPTKFRQEKVKKVTKFPR